MKRKIFQQSMAVSVGAVLLFAVHTARADEPKHKRHTKTERAEANSTSIPAPAKTGSRPGTIATRDGRNSVSVEGGLAGGANGRETRVPTGSNIPQTYNRRGHTTDDGNNRFIIDENDQRIQRTDNPGDILRTIPGVTVRGSR